MSDAQGFDCFLPHLHKESRCWMFQQRMWWCWSHNASTQQFNIGTSSTVSYETHKLYRFTVAYQLTGQITFPSPAERIRTVATFSGKREYHMSNASLWINQPMISLTLTYIIAWLICETLSATIESKCVPTIIIQAPAALACITSNHLNNWFVIHSTVSARVRTFRMSWNISGMFHT